MLCAFVNYQQDNWDSCLPTLEFAYNNSKQASTEHPPFFLNYGHHPRTPAALLTQTNTPAADDFVLQIQNLTQAAQDALALAQANQEKYANENRTHMTFALGDLVLLSSAHINLASQQQRPTRKLQNRFLGPYPIMKVISPVTYKLDLPPSMPIHPVFHVSLLKKYNDPSMVPGRPVLERPPPEVVDDAEEYEVEAILDKRTHRRKLQYLVKWKGYHESDSTWENEENLANSPDLVADFNLNRSGT